MGFSFFVKTISDILATRETINVLEELQDTINEDIRLTQQNLDTGLMLAAKLQEFDTKTAEDLLIIEQMNDATSKLKQEISTLQQELQTITEIMERVVEQRGFQKTITK
jgi:uncharacterized coiled-coil DUF342 family protein